MNTNSKIPSWLVKIGQKQDQGIKWIGTGFFINSHTILTCKHVAIEPHEELVVYNNNANRIQIKQVFNHPSVDIAIIIAANQSSYAAKIQLTPFSQNTNESHPNEFIAAGFDLEFSSGALNSRVFSEQDLKYALVSEHNSGKVNTLRAKGGLPKGFSGGPLYAKNNNSVIGMSILGGTTSVQSLFYTSDQIIECLNELNTTCPYYVLPSLMYFKSNAEDNICSLNKEIQKQEKWYKLLNQSQQTVTFYLPISNSLQRIKFVLVPEYSHDGETIEPGFWMQQSLFMQDNQQLLNGLSVIQIKEYIQILSKELGLLPIATNAQWLRALTVNKTVPLPRKPNTRAIAGKLPTNITYQTNEFGINLTPSNLLELTISDCTKAVKANDSYTACSAYRVSNQQIKQIKMPAKIKKHALVFRLTLPFEAIFNNKFLRTNNE